MKTGPVTTTLRSGREGGGAKGSEVENRRTSGGCSRREDEEEEAKKTRLLLLLMQWNQLNTPTICLFDQSPLFSACKQRRRTAATVSQRHTVKAEAAAKGAGNLQNNHEVFYFYKHSLPYNNNNFYHLFNYIF